MATPANWHPGEDTVVLPFIADRGHVDQLVLQRGVAVDGGVDGCVQPDDGPDAAHIVAEAIDEGRVVTEQCAQGRHVVAVPGGLERRQRVFGLSDLNHVPLASLRNDRC